MPQFIGEIRLLPYLSFVPDGWVLCEGQLLAVREHTALASLLKTRYGGDGNTTFGVPDLRGRAVVCGGQGQGLQAYRLGDKAGSETVTLLPGQMAAHGHFLQPAIPANGARGTGTSPQGSVYALTPAEQYGSTPNNGGMSRLLNGTSDAAGGDQPHENRMPFLVLTYCIAVQGIYPTPS